MVKAVEQEKQRLVLEPTSEESQAGIDNFKKFGEFNTIYALADGDLLRFEDVLQIDYNTVFLKLEYSKLKTEYQRRLYKILNPKTK